MLAACIVWVSATPLSSVSHAAQAAETAATGVPAAAAFEKLKALEGTWRVADNAEHPLRIRFYPSARGNTLVESWEVEGRSHSLTIYHRDGDTLLATHYCPQGNQPRMALAERDDGSIGFTFRDVTDLDAETEQHQHDLSFDVSAADRLVRSENYRDGEGKLHPSQLVLMRVTE
ncbi:MAG TPA: hypothetical protein VFY00_02535 [Arenimonas sp.]|nr:hypothetical protein [Arenimonas sp.]